MDSESVAVKRVLPLSALLLVACFGDGEEGNFRPTDAGGTMDSGVGGMAGAPADAGQVDSGPIRTVETRNPFGNAAFADNLLVDGDFELTGPSGQYGWRSLEPFGGDSPLRRETGGFCRSGVVCAELSPGMSLIGFGASPDGEAIEVSLYAKPPEPDCDGLTVSLISCTTFEVQALADVPAVGDEPDESGWCRYMGTSPPLDEQACLYLETSRVLSGDILIDEAYMKAAEPSARMSLHATVPTLEHRARIDHALDWIDRNRWYGLPPDRPDP